MEELRDANRNGFDTRSLLGYAQCIMQRRALVVIVDVDGRAPCPGRITPPYNLIIDAIRGTPDAVRSSVDPPTKWDYFLFERCLDPLDIAFLSAWLPETFPASVFFSSTLITPIQIHQGHDKNSATIPQVFLHPRTGPPYQDQRRSVAGYRASSREKGAGQRGRARRRGLKNEEGGAQITGFAISGSLDQIAGK